MICEPGSQGGKLAKRRYLRDMVVAGALYVTFVFAAALAIRNFDLPQWALVGLALLPVAPALMMLRAYLVHLSAMDEFQRRLQIDALTMSAGLVMFSTFAYGFLEEWARFPPISLIWVFPVFSFTFGITHIVIRRRYK